MGADARHSISWFNFGECEVEFLQSGPAETTAYMIAGYAVIFGVMFLFVVSLLVRWRNLKLDLALLQDMDAQEE